MKSRGDCAPLRVGRLKMKRRHSENINYRTKTRTNKLERKRSICGGLIIQVNTPSEHKGSPPVWPFVYELL